MAQLPKPPGQRVRRSGSQSNWRVLPPAEPFKPPGLPRRNPAWSKPTREWWRVLWASPMASTYLEADLPGLVRLAEMVEARSRGELGATETVAMTALEDRFGLNPKARRALQWEIAQAAGDAADAADVADIPRLYAVADAS
jgi:hypothetical protein